MAYCRNCGAQIGDDTVFCPRCGTRVKEYVAYRQPQYNDDTGSFGWAVLGFFVPVVGLILYLVWKDTKPRTAATAGKGALCSVIIEFVLFLLIMCAGAMS